MKTSARTVEVPTKIRTGNFPNTSLEPYRWTWLLGVSEEPAASIFRVEETSILKTETADSSETLIHFYHRPHDVSFQRKRILFPLDFDLFSENITAFPWLSCEVQERTCINSLDAEECK
jgi:hypothetical protein